MRNVPLAIAMACVFTGGSAGERKLRFFNILHCLSLILPRPECDLLNPVLRIIDT